MTPRLRPNLAWALRGIARWLNSHAERIEPIKINRPIGSDLVGKRTPLTHKRIELAHFNASKSAAHDAIERARQLKAVR